MLRSGAPFFVGRMGMGHETEVACKATVQRPARGSPAFNKSFAGIRWDLKKLNGILTSSASDAAQYGACYGAAVNATDLMVRYSGDYRKPLRASNTSRGLYCSTHSHFQRADAILARSGHYPRRVVRFEVIEPWIRPVAEGSDEDALHWTAALAGRTVLVVHPFDRSIRTQYAKGGQALWGNISERVLPPTMTLKIVRAPQNLGRSEESGAAGLGWREALRVLIERVDAAGPFDVALMACGGLGMPLGAYLRATNRSSMYMGGARAQPFAALRRPPLTSACAVRPPQARCRCGSA